MKKFHLFHIMQNINLKVENIDLSNTQHELGTFLCKNDLLPYRTVLWRNFLLNNMINVINFHIIVEKHTNCCISRKGWFAKVFTFSKLYILLSQDNKKSLFSWHKMNDTPKPCQSPNLINKIHCALLRKFYIWLNQPFSCVLQILPLPLKLINRCKFLNTWMISLMYISNTKSSTFHWINKQFEQGLDQLHGTVRTYLICQVWNTNISTVIASKEYW